MFFCRSIVVFIDSNDFAETNVFNAAVEDMIVVVEDELELPVAQPASGPSPDSGPIQVIVDGVEATPEPVPVAAQAGNQYALITACTGTGATKPNGDAIVRNVSPAEYIAANATAGHFSFARVRLGFVNVLILSACQCMHKLQSSSTGNKLT